MPYKDPDREKACQRRRYRRLSAERIANNLCPKCGKAPPEPGRRLCTRCQSMRRAAERALWARARAQGKPYGGGNTEARRKAARAKTKRRYDKRLAAGLCARCGERPPDDGSVSCGVCKSGRNTRERAQWNERRASGLCGVCGEPSPAGAARCEPCATIQAGRPSRKENGRKRYARRRARNLCTDCGQPSQGAARCPPCARRSWARSGQHRGIPAWPARYTVIDRATGEDHGTYDSHAEVAACLAFAKLAPNDVEIVSDTSVMASWTSW